MSRIKKIKGKSIIGLIVSLILLAGIVVVTTGAILEKMYPSKMEKVDLLSVTKGKSYYIEVKDTSDEYSYDSKEKYYYVLSLTTEDKIVDLRVSSKAEAEKLISLPEGKTMRFTGESIPLSNSTYDELVDIFAEDGYEVSPYGLEGYTTFDYVFPALVGLFFAGLAIFAVVNNVKSKRKALEFLKQNPHLDSAPTNYTVCKGTEIVENYLIQTISNGKIINLYEFDDFKVQTNRYNFIAVSHTVYFIKNNVKKQEVVALKRMNRKKLDEFIFYLDYHFFSDEAMLNRNVDTNVSTTPILEKKHRPQNQGPDLG